MKVILGILLSVAFFSCKPKDDIQPDSHLAEKNKLLDADRAFSAMSKKEGMKAAFLFYIDSNGVLLRPDNLPIVGANAIDFLIEQDDSKYTLTWEPHFGEVANSGDLGYTFGIFELEPKGVDTSIYGSYTTLWKKQKDGSWKFVLGSGNEGIGSQSEVTGSEGNE